MKRIIDIPEEEYKRFISYKSNKYAPYVKNAPKWIMTCQIENRVKQSFLEDCKYWEPKDEKQSGQKDS